MTILHDSKQNGESNGKSRARKASKRARRKAIVDRWLAETPPSEVLAELQGARPEFNPVLDPATGLDFGAMTKDLGAALQNAANDCEKRPTDDRARQVTLGVEITPTLREDGTYNGVSGNMLIATKLPPRKSRTAEQPATDADGHRHPVDVRDIMAFEPKPGPMRTFKVISAGIPESAHEGRGLTVDDVIAYYVSMWQPDETDPPCHAPHDLAIFESGVLVATVRNLDDGRGGHCVVRFDRPDAWLPTPENMRPAHNKAPAPAPLKPGYAQGDIHVDESTSGPYRTFVRVYREEVTGVRMGHGLTIEDMIKDEVEEIQKPGDPAEESYDVTFQEFGQPVATVRALAGSGGRYEVMWHNGSRADGQSAAPTAEPESDTETVDYHDRSPRPGPRRTFTVDQGEEVLDVYSGAGLTLDDVVGEEAKCFPTVDGSQRQEYDVHFREGGRLLATARVHGDAKGSYTLKRFDGELTREQARAELAQAIAVARQSEPPTDEPAQPDEPRTLIHAMIRDAVTAYVDARENHAMAFNDSLASPWYDLSHRHERATLVNLVKSVLMFWYQGHDLTKVNGTAFQWTASAVRVRGYIVSIEPHRSAEGELDHAFDQAQATVIHEDDFHDLTVDRKTAQNPLPWRSFRVSPASDASGANVVEGRGITLADAIAEATRTIREIASDGRRVDMVVVEQDAIVARVMAEDVLGGAVAENEVA